MDIYLFDNGITLCLIKFAERDDSNFNMLGITFLESYQQFYSIDHNQMAFRPNSLVQPKVIKTGFNEDSVIIATIAITFVLGILFHVTSYSAIVCCKDPQLQQESPPPPAPLDTSNNLSNHDLPYEQDQQRHSRVNTD